VQVVVTSLRRRQNKIKIRDSRPAQGAHEAQLSSHVVLRVIYYCHLHSPPSPVARQRMNIKYPSKPGPSPHFIEGVGGLPVNSKPHLSDRVLLVSNSTNYLHCQGREMRKIEYNLDLIETSTDVLGPMSHIFILGTSLGS